jgi:hypothetical protein
MVQDTHNKKRVFYSYMYIRSVTPNHTGNLHHVTYRTGTNELQIMRKRSQPGLKVQIVKHKIKAVS